MTDLTRAAADGTTGAAARRPGPVVTGADLPTDALIDGADVPPGELDADMAAAAALVG